jgi:hypothetical protein
MVAISICIKVDDIVIEDISSTWLAMSANVSVGYPPQMTDIFVCRRHVGNVVPTRRQHSDMSANFSAVGVVSVTSFPTHFPTCT